MYEMTVRHVVEPLSCCRAVEPDSGLYSSVVGDRNRIETKFAVYRETGEQEGLAGRVSRRERGREGGIIGTLMERDMQFLKDCRGTVLTTPNTR